MLSGWREYTQGKLPQIKTVLKPLIFRLSRAIGHLDKQKRYKTGKTGKNVFWKTIKETKIDNKKNGKLFPIVGCAKGILTV